MKNKIRIITKDPLFEKTVALLLTEEGFEVCTKSVPAICPLIIDIDTAALPEDRKYSTVIAFSDHPKSIVQSTEDSFFAVLGKPVNFRELLEAIDSADRSAGRQLCSFAENVKMPEIIFDNSARILRCGACHVRLTPNEAEILGLLTDRRGSTVTKKQIADLLHNTHNSNKTEVYICSLRKKLAKLCLYPVIETVRGEGYSIK